MTRKVLWLNIIKNEEEIKSVKFIWWRKSFFLFGFCCGLLYIYIMEKKLEQFDNQYSVTDIGIVYSLKGKKKELIGKITKSRYREVVINHKGKRNIY